MADGGTRHGQHAELASGTCVRIAKNIYRSDAGDVLIESIARVVNSELLRRVSEDEPIGSTTLAMVHASASGRVLGTILGDGAILRLRRDEPIETVRSLRKYDYYFEDETKLHDADALYDTLPWWLRVSIMSSLPWASQGIVPRLVALRPEPGDLLVVCSDGISELMSPRNIAAATEGHRPHDVTAALIAAARALGGRDDATCAVARWP